MGETRFLVYLDEARQNRYRHWHVWDRGEITRFRIQYESLIAGRWHAVVRYDSVHDRPHRDTLRPDGTESKDWFPDYSNAEVLTIGQRDIRENWPKYRTSYEKEQQR